MYVVLCFCIAAVLAQIILQLPQRVVSGQSLWCH